MVMYHYNFDYSIQESLSEVCPYFCCNEVFYGKLTEFPGAYNVLWKLMDEVHASKYLILGKHHMHAGRYIQECTRSLHVIT